MSRQPTVSTDSVAQDVLQSFFARWQRLEDEKSAISDDLKELFAEAKGLGFDTKVMRKVFRDKTADQADRDLFEAIYDLYWAAIGGGSGPEPEAADFDEPRARPARAREGWNVDENGDGPLRRMTKARQAIFDTLEVEGVIAGRDTGRCVYFLHAPDAGVLKIGSSDDVMKRVKGLQGASPVPLVLLGSIGGGLEHELELHGLFADRRVHGEWFTADEDFLTNIRWRIARDAHEATPPHDPVTGELIEGNEPASSEAQVRSERGGEGGEDAPALSADTQSQPGRSEAPRQIEAGLVAKVEDQSTAAAGRSPVDTHPEPGNGEAGASPAPAPEPAAEGTAHNPIPSAVPGNMQNLHNAPGSIRTERTHTEGVERHQFAVWPEYQGRAHADLVDDVRTNGVREPIVMQGRIILDGWARYLAAREAGVSYPVQEYAGDDPLRDIITLNMASRSLNLVERQSIAKKLTKLAPDRADEIGELLDLQQQREAAQ